MNEDITQGNNEQVVNNESWLSSLPDELKSAESLSKFKDVGALATSYLEAERSLNNRVAIPKADASDSEWNKFYQRIGVPQDKKYIDKRNTEDEEYLSKYEEMFYNSGITSRQGKKLLEHFYNFSTDLQKKQATELEQNQASNLEWLKSNYGDEFDNKMTVMQAALQKFGTRELADLIEESSYSPPLIDLLVRVGETLKSDSLVTGNQPAAITNSDAALKEIKKLESDDGFMVKLNSKNHTGHAEAVRRMENLYKIAYDKK